MHKQRAEAHRQADLASLGRVKRVPIRQESLVRLERRVDP